MVFIVVVLGVDDELVFESAPASILERTIMGRVGGVDARFNGSGLATGYGSIGLTLARIQSK